MIIITIKMIITIIQNAGIVFPDNVLKVQNPKKLECAIAYVPKINLNSLGRPEDHRGWGTFF